MTGSRKRRVNTLLAEPTVPPPGGEAAGFKLVMIRGPQIGREVPLEDVPLEVGREDCALTVPSDQLSRQHYVIEPAGTGYRVRDLDSTNGTSVNGSPVRERFLVPGDLIKAGGVVFKFMEAHAVEARYHAEMSKLVTTDALTGARNKRYFDDEYARLAHLARDTGEPLSLIVLDIDFFKKVNDTHGHAAGDHVLVEVSEVIGSTLRPGDVFARVGGEEFAIVMPKATRAIAAGMAEMVRATVESTAIAFEGTSIAVTLSLGIAELDHAAEESPQALYQRADARLYAAKEAGRNQIQ